MKRQNRNFTWVEKVQNLTRRRLTRLRDVPSKGKLLLKLTSVILSTASNARLVNSSPTPSSKASISTSQKISIRYFSSNWKKRKHSTKFKDKAFLQRNALLNKYSYSLHESSLKYYDRKWRSGPFNCIQSYTKVTFQHHVGFYLPVLLEWTIH